MTHSVGGSFFYFYKKERHNIKKGEEKVVRVRPEKMKLGIGKKERNGREGKKSTTEDNKFLTYGEIK